MGTEMHRNVGRDVRGTDPYFPGQGPSVVYAGRVGGGAVGDVESSSGFANVESLPPAPDPAKKEQLHRFVGLGVGLASVVAEHVLSHPCIVLRRQCQVNHDSTWFHLTPVTLFQPIFNIQRHQSVTTLWKGIGSTLMVKGIGVASESLMSEVTPFPKEVTRHSSLRKLAEHLVLKSVSCLVITPFYAGSLVETVQSEIASEPSGVFDCLREGGKRLMSLSTSQTTRLLPVWQLMLPTMFHGVLHYVISSLAKYTVAVSLKAEIMDSKGHVRAGEPSPDTTLYEAYYPELIATFTGNLLADIVLYPLETILHRLLLQGTRTIIDDTDTGLGVVPITTRYEGPMDCFFGIVSEEGFGGLYKGFGALMLQYGMHMVLLKLTRVLFERLSQEMTTLRKVKDSPRRSASTEAHLSQLSTQPRYDPRAMVSDPRYDPRAMGSDPRLGYIDPRVGPADVNSGASYR